MSSPSDDRARSASDGHRAPASYPLLQSKAYDEPSVFQPASLLREARRQKALRDVPVPTVCVLDPDGDIVRWLKATGHGRQHAGWACYHTEMWSTEVDGLELGVVGMAVGAPFAVLVAEQLAASGADLVISVTSAGQITQLAEPPYFVLIERAWRDEGTSAHYQPPSPWSELNHATARAVRAITSDGRTTLDREPRQDADPFPGGEPILCGSSWTTDAPYRETSTAIAAAAAEGIACVEMEAAALYAYATATGRTVVCLAHVTNTMAVDGDDFEKGAAGGAVAALQVVRAVASAVATAGGRR